MRFFASPKIFLGTLGKLKDILNSRIFADEERLPAKSMSEATERNRIAVVAALVIAAALLAPDVRWALRDQSNWDWDQAVYASAAVNLFRATEGGIAAWAQAMAHVTAGLPPLMVWAGQLAVPLRHVFGDVGFVLLLFNLLWDGAVFWFVYVISRRLGAGPIEALTALVACGASGIVIALNHQFLVETPQCAAAAFMMFAAFQIETRSWLRALSMLVLATVISMLSKASSITFAVPLLCYAVLVLFVTRSRPKPTMRPMDLLLAAVAAGSVFALFAWYRENLAYVMHHFHEATTDEYALNWGSEVRLGPKLSYWTSWLAKSLSPFLAVPFAAGAVILSAMILSAIRFRRTKDWSLIETAIDNGSLFVLALFGTVSATLLAFSLQINEDTRFLISLIPIIAVLLGWALSVLQIRLLTASMLVALAAGGLVNHAISFGYNSMGFSSFNYLISPKNGPERQLLTAAVRATCHDGNDGRPNFVAVTYRWLNPHAASFATAKEALLRGSGPCTYWGVDNRESTTRAMDTMLSYNPRYIITVSAEKLRQAEAAGEPKLGNGISRSLAEALARDPRFVRLPESNDSVLIYQPAAEASASK